MSDLISREAVLKIIENYDINKYGANKYLWDLIYELPSAETDLSEYSDKLRCKDGG